MFQHLSDLYGWHIICITYPGYSNSDYLGSYTHTEMASIIDQIATSAGWIYDQQVAEQILNEEIQNRPSTNENINNDNPVRHSYLPQSSIPGSFHVLGISSGCSYANLASALLPKGRILSTNLIGPFLHMGAHKTAQAPQPNFFEEPATVIRAVLAFGVPSLMMTMQYLNLGRNAKDRLLANGMPDYYNAMYKKLLHLLFNSIVTIVFSVGISFIGIRLHSLYQYALRYLLQRDGHFDMINAVYRDAQRCVTRTHLGLKGVFNLLIGTPPFPIKQISQGKSSTQVEASYSTKSTTQVELEPTPTTISPQNQLKDNLLIPTRIFTDIAVEPIPELTCPCEFSYYYAEQIPGSKLYTSQFGHGHLFVVLAPVIKDVLRIISEAKDVKASGPKESDIVTGYTANQTQTTSGIFTLQRTVSEGRSQHQANIHHARVNLQRGSSKSALLVRRPEGHLRGAIWDTYQFCKTTSTDILFFTLILFLALSLSLTSWRIWDIIDVPVTLRAAGLLLLGPFCGYVSIWAIQTLQLFGAVDTLLARTFEQDLRKIWKSIQVKHSYTGAGTLNARNRWKRTSLKIESMRRIKNIGENSSAGRENDMDSAENVKGNGSGGETTIRRRNLNGSDNTNSNRISSISKDKSLREYSSTALDDLIERTTRTVSKEHKSHSKRKVDNFKEDIKGLEVEVPCQVVDKDVTNTASAGGNNNNALNTPRKRPILTGADVYRFKSKKSNKHNKNTFTDENYTDDQSSSSSKFLLGLLFIVALIFNTSAGCEGIGIRIFNWSNADDFFVFDFNNKSSDSTTLVISILYIISGTIFPVAIGYMFSVYYQCYIHIKKYLESLESFFRKSSEISLDAFFRKSREMNCIDNANNTTHIKKDVADGSLFRPNGSNTIIFAPFQQLLSFFPCLISHVQKEVLQNLSDTWEIFLGLFLGINFLFLVAAVLSLLELPLMEIVFDKTSNVSITGNNGIKTINKSDSDTTTAIALFSILISTISCIIFTVFTMSGITNRCDKVLDAVNDISKDLLSLEFQNVSDLENQYGVDECQGGKYQTDGSHNFNRDKTDLLRQSQALISWMEGLNSGSGFRFVFAGVGVKDIYFVSVAYTICGGVLAILLNKIHGDNM